MKTRIISITKKQKALKKYKKVKERKKYFTGYGVKKNTISIWIANKTNIMEAYESDQINHSREKLRKSDKRDLDEAIFI